MGWWPGMIRGNWVSGYPRVAEWIMSGTQETLAGASLHCNVLWPKLLEILRSAELFGTDSSKIKAYILLPGGSLNRLRCWMRPRELWVKMGRSSLSIIIQLITAYITNLLELWQMNRFPSCWLCRTLSSTKLLSSLTSRLSLEPQNVHGAMVTAEKRKWRYPGLNTVGLPCLWFALADWANCLLENILGISIVVQHMKLAFAMPASYITVLVWVPTAPFPIQPPAGMPEKAPGLSPGSHVRDLDGVLGVPILAISATWGVSPGWKILSLSFSVTLFFKHIK